MKLPMPAEARVLRGPAEIELTIHNAKGHLRSRDNSGDPWNPPTYPEQWLANSQNNARRADWIDSLKRFSKMELGERGVNAVAENGKMVVVQA